MLLSMIKRKYFLMKYNKLNNEGKYNFISSLNKKDIRILFNMKKNELVPILPPYKNFFYIMSFRLTKEQLNQIIEWVDKYIPFVYTDLKITKEDVNTIIVGSHFRIGDGSYSFIGDKQNERSTAYAKLIEHFIINKNESIDELIEEIIKKNYTNLLVCQKILKIYEKYENDKYLKIKLKYI